MKFLKDITETVRLLHFKKDSNKKIAELLSDIAWHEETLCLELLVSRLNCMVFGPVLLKINMRLRPA